MGHAGRSQKRRSSAGVRSRDCTATTNFHSAGCWSIRGYNGRREPTIRGVEVALAVARDAGVRRAASTGASGHGDRDRAARRHPAGRPRDDCRERVASRSARCLLPTLRLRSSGRDGRRRLSGVPSPGRDAAARGCGDSPWGVSHPIAGVVARGQVHAVGGDGGGSREPAWARRRRRARPVAIDQRRRRGGADAHARTSALASRHRPCQAPRTVGGVGPRG